MGICDVGTDEGNKVDPKLVECTKSGGCSLALGKSSGLTVEPTSASS